MKLLGDKYSTQFKAKGVKLLLNNPARSGALCFREEIT